MRTQLKDEDHIPEMPELVGHAQMLDHLWSVGPVLAGGSGPVPLTHVEIGAWQANTGQALNCWEANLLRSLSIAYLTEFEAAKSPGRQAPFVTCVTLDDRARVAQQIQSQFEAYIRNAEGAT